jgi:hypothetical protein
VAAGKRDDFGKVKPHKRRTVRFGVLASLVAF